MGSEILQPPGWPRPKGYANGMAASGRLVLTGGQVGWDTEGQFPAGLPAQVGQCLENIVAVLAEGGAAPEHLVRLTWYITDRDAYLNELQEIGREYRRVLGKNYPAMAVVQVIALVESEAMVEIEATAVVPD